MIANDFDYILVGGGLQSGLLSSALRHHKPEVRILLIEQDARLAGNHTWSFHPNDVPAPSEPWVKRLIAYQWNGYQVRFPGFTRQIHLTYACTTSERLRGILDNLFQESSGSVYLTSTKVVSLEANEVTTESGARYRGQAVIDCRGSGKGHLQESGVGFQKFVGLEVELERPWPESCPTLMDGCTEQVDGFRFVYTLPFTKHNVLIEDTCFSDRSAIDRDAHIDRIQAYLRSKVVGGWKVIREETGCLPMPYSESMLPHASVPLAGGYAGGWFHAATGYSFPLAVRFAEAVASVSPSNAFGAVSQLADEHQQRAKFSRFLNRLLYRLVRPETRWQIFRRFYRVLPEQAIARFYAHEFTRLDAARIVIGMPPSGLTPFRFLNTRKAIACPSTVP